MKNFNICGVHRKIHFREHSREQAIYRGDCLKRLGQFADLRGASQERGGGGVERGLICQCTL